MVIGGMVKNSFVDYPGKIACVVFTTGCNFNCWYCHNSHLLNYNKKTIAQEEVFNFLQTHKSFIDAVVVSGGEPTLQKDLVEFIKKVKGMGFLVKLDTNGSNPEVLQFLIKNNLVDYVAMDIKSNFKKYNLIAQVSVDVNLIKQSISILLNSGIDYEFRTTFSPDLDLTDISEICKQIKGAKRYCIQKYNVVDYNPKNMTPYHKDIHLKAQEIAKDYVKEVVVKGV